MKACQLGNQTGLESLVAAEMPEPVAGPGQIIVAPRLVGLINRDLQTPASSPKRAFPLPKAWAS
ncbi:hypothetical protein ACU16_01310 [Xanthomonas oryzae pv. oryzicola]|nr:hypothetical protein ACU16_01310 [Xanthomonas oryzae pv. oryzicola]